MKRILLPLLLCALLLTACGDKQEPAPSSAVGPLPAAVGKQDAQKEAVRAAAEEALAGVFDGEVSVKARTDRVEVSVLLNDPAYSGDGEAPADWAARKTEAAETTLSLSEALSDLGEYRTLIYLMDQQETILLSAFNGKALFDKFERKAKTERNGITLEAYEQITEGMLYQEVCDLIGGEGELLSSVEDGDLLTELYTWSNSDGGSATVVFENGAMTSKSQVGLEPSFDSGPSGSSGGMMTFPMGGGIAVAVERVG